MTYLEYVKKKTVLQLKNNLKQLNDSIDKVQCFGVKDILLREYIEYELQVRGKL